MREHRKSSSAEAVEAVDVRQGQTIGVMRYVLTVSLALAASAMIAAYFVAL